MTKVLCFRLFIIFTCLLFVNCLKSVANNGIGFRSNNTCACLRDIREGFENKTESCSIFKIKYSSTNAPNLISLWDKFPLNIMENVTTIQPTCKQAYNNYLKKLHENDMEAVKMFDASGKLPSGLLSGNLNQYGDFDECMDLNNAQYCLAEIDLRPIWDEKYSQFQQLVHSHFAIQETFNDPKHRIPGFTMARWGFCIPRECSHSDLENAIFEKTGAPSYIRPSMCQKTNIKPAKLTIGDILSRIFFATILLMIIVATFLENNYPKIGCDQRKLVRILLAFSFQKNWKQLTTIKGEQSREIRAVNGIRALSALALIMSHKCMALFYNPLLNKRYMMESLGMKWAVIGRTAIIYTDSFMLLSGLLNANALFSDLIRKNEMNFKDKLIGRIFRISPNVIAVILFCTYILPSMGSGPLWPLVINHHSELCKKYMWRNMLYIHNYYGFDNMCLTHTHQIGIDMQLFLVTPFLVYLIWKNRRIGLWACLILAILSSVLRMVVTYQHELSHMVHYGIQISRLFRTANLSYILPTHRATIYLMGVYLAYLLKFTNPETTVSRIKQVFLWVFFLSLSASAALGPYHMAMVGYEYNLFDAIIYGTFSPIVWGAGIAFVIFWSNRGYAGWLGDVLTWSKFEFFSKISYALYLVQFPVFFYNVGKTKHVDYYTEKNLLELPEILFIIFASVALTLFIEMPFQTIKKIIFNDENNSTKNKNTNGLTKVVKNGEVYQEIKRTKSKLG